MHRHIKPIIMFFILFVMQSSLCMEEESKQGLIEYFCQEIPKGKKSPQDLLFELTSKEVNQQDAQEAIDFLCRHKAEINALNSDGFTPLMSATLAGSLPLVKALITCGAHVNQRATKKLGGTALFVAGFYGFKEIATYLLECNADTTVKDANEETAYDMAKNTGNLTVADLIKNYKKTN